MRKNSIPLQICSLLGIRKKRRIYDFVMRSIDAQDTFKILYLNGILDEVLHMDIP
jgi:hypothetical protein